MTHQHQLQKKKLEVVNAAGDNGVFLGNTELLSVQAFVVLVTRAYAFGVTFILFKILDWTIGLRLSKEDEDSGLDLSQRSETGYFF